MTPDLHTIGAPQTELYCDVLVRYLLTLSTVGDCALARTLEAALDSGLSERLAHGLHHFDTQPYALRRRILAGDPTLETLLDSVRAPEDAPFPSA